ncbi:MAG: anthranilate phosphoribosyltransferase [Candidatus Xiphinematobacter sp.]|nr:MAG: anthranilate phosphoribosyltransferase [Candidatus Xiphinematobacter sp.]
MNDTWTRRILSREELSRKEIQEVCCMLLDEKNTLETKAEFLRALHYRGETPREIASFAEVLLEQSINPIPAAIRNAGVFLDVCGTGGDGLGLFNVSTAVMFVAAACGALVVKTGNRGFTSRSGGADVLEALGVNLSIPVWKVPVVLESTGCIFLFAAAYYPALRAVTAVRRLLSKENIPTVFNFLGPLLNPVRPNYQLVGVANPLLMESYAYILGLLGREAAWVVCGNVESSARVMDEVSIVGQTKVCTLQQDGKRRLLQISPHCFGIATARVNDLLGGNARENACILLDILKGLDRGPRRNMVLANTAAALCVCKIATNLLHGIELASEAINSGEAFLRLQRLIKLSHQ